MHQLYPSHYLQIHSSVHAQLYSFSQHRLIWFGLGAPYNRKRARNDLRGGKAAVLQDGQRPCTRAWPRLCPPPQPRIGVFYLEFSCMCPPIGRIMRDASSPGSDRMLRSIYTLLHMSETVKTHSHWSRRSDHKQISWLTSHSQSARERTISK